MGWERSLSKYHYRQNIFNIGMLIEFITNKIRAGEQKVKSLKHLAPLSLLPSSTFSLSAVQGKGFMVSSSHVIPAAACGEKSFLSEYQGTLLNVWMTEHWHRFPRDILESSFLEIHIQKLSGHGLGWLLLGGPV